MRNGRGDRVQARLLVGGGWGELGQAGRQNLNAALELDPAKAAYNQQIGTIASTFR